MLSYLKFFFSSTNEHGVHSPFIFNFVTKCLYAKPKLSKNKTENVLFNSIKYFGSQNILVDDKKIEAAIEQVFPDSKFNQKPYDLVYFKSPEYKKPINIFSTIELHNDSVLIFDQIRKNKAYYTYGCNFIMLNKVTVSIDMYRLGIVFIRKEQEKEHFRIRL